MKIINVLGSPGVGKSCFAARLFGEMKCQGMSVEYVDEYAKHKVYENNSKALKCQPYIFGNQLFNIARIEDAAEFVITDSPIILAPIYNKVYPDSFETFVVDTHNSFDNFNIFLEMSLETEFQEEGRIHNLEQSLLIENDIVNLLQKHGIGYNTVDRNTDLSPIVSQILAEKTDD